MSRHAERELATSKKSLVEKIDEIKSYVSEKGSTIKINYTRQTSCRKSWKLESITFQKDWEQVETSAVSKSEEEEKHLSEFEELQSIIDTAGDTKIDLEYHERIIREKLEEMKEEEIKEREERERDIQREMEERRWTKEKEFELELEREKIHIVKLKVEFGSKIEIVKCKSEYRRHCST